MEHLNKHSAYLANRDAIGNVRMWRVNTKDGAKELIIQKHNIITKEGADIAARALSGLPNTAITHIYVGYNDSGTPPEVTVDDTVLSFTDFVRKPLTFSPSFSNETGYEGNLVYFSTYITGTDIPNGKNVISLGLVNALSPADASLDKLFSKISFAGVPYDSSHGLAITWGITFRAQS